MFPQYLDWINVMTYDYHGQWDKKTGQFRQKYINWIKLFSYYMNDFELLMYKGHVAPMYEHPDDDFYFFNAVKINFLRPKNLAIFGIHKCSNMLGWGET